MATMQQSNQSTHYFFAGLKLIFQPGMRRFVFIPLTLNIILFSVMIYYSIGFIDSQISNFIAWLPEFLSFLSWLIWPIALILMCLLVFFSFSLIANFIAAPFNGFLSEAVEKHTRQQQGLPVSETPLDWKELSLLIPRTLSRELRKLGYIVPRWLLLVILTFIPVINFIAPIVWLIWGAWMMAVQYADFPADNNKVPFPALLNKLKQRKSMTYSFGGLVYLMTLIPFVNLLVIPAAVAGGTILWVNEKLYEQ
ncbi:sulfate transporter CysZ [Zooshikella ganghwensis]|uniref:sulfate transporter CysZ n=2 Tax=Zooshikella ganghwensis TaxID=202772 RepID=UPI001BAF39EC|nr:sulfate transporter CysZ [Zooshikella ganghwensis]